MKYTLSISAALLLAMSQAQPSLAQNGANNLVKQAIAAEGGADALRALKGLAIKGEAKFWEPEQSEKAGGEPRFLGDATFTVTWDLANGTARTAWDRDQKYPAPVRLKYIETVSPSLGYVTDDKGSQAMSGIRVAAHLRELERTSPWLLVKAMDAPKSVAPWATRSSASSRCRRCRSMTAGRSSRSCSIQNPSARCDPHARRRQHPRRLGLRPGSRRLEGSRRRQGCALAVLPAQRRRSREAHLQGSVRESDDRGRHFAAPDAVKSAAKGPAKSNVPYQWVCAASSSPGSSIVIRSFTRREAASSWSSLRPMCSMYRAARPTT